MNRLAGVIDDISSDDGLHLITVRVGTDHFTAMHIGAGDDAPAAALQAPVTLLFKETEVALARDLRGEISLRNRAGARITALAHGKLLSVVTLDYQGTPLTAIITRSSAQRLLLACGDEIEWLVKANEMAVDFHS